MTLTVTVTAAFRATFQALFLNLHDDDASSAHLTAVWDTCEWVGEWLSEHGHAGLGFTAFPSHGGGAGWDTEAGVTFVFANVLPQDEHRVRAFARALCRRESQTAVAYTVRQGEAFVLVSDSD